MRPQTIAALAAVLTSIVPLTAFAQDEGQAGPPPPIATPTDDTPEATAAPTTASATYAAPAGVKEQWVWLTDQKLWGFGYQLQDGPYKGKWRLKTKSASAPAISQSTQVVQQAAYTPTAAYVPKMAYAPQATAAAQPMTYAQPARAVPATSGDPTGFVAILNQMRASAGLPPVSYDPSLSSWASQNNAAQSSRGLGHHVNPGAMQNSGWNYGSAAAVAQGWMASPGHRAAMLAAGISRVGIAYGPGPYWTMNAQ